MPGLDFAILAMRQPLSQTGSIKGMAAEQRSDTVIFDFTSQDLGELVISCDLDALLPVIIARVPAGAAILEAGAGSGRWVKALADRGYAATGIELNRADVERFRRSWPDLPFDHGNVEALPYPADSFDAMLSLGVIEHLFKGPEQAIAEMRRTLKPGATLLLTIPVANLSFRLEQVKDALFHRLYGSPLIRRLLGKPALGFTAPAQRQRLRRIARNRRPGTSVKYRFEPETGRTFYEYRYTTNQAIALLEKGGFDIETAKLLYPGDRLYQIFGRLVGQYDGCRPPCMNPLGRLLLRLLPEAWIGHMLLLVAHPSRPEYPDR